MKIELRASEEQKIDIEQVVANRTFAPTLVEE